MLVELSEDDLLEILKIFDAAYSENIPIDFELYSHIEDFLTDCDDEDDED